MYIRPASDSFDVPWRDSSILPSPRQDVCLLNFCLLKMNSVLNESDVEHVQTGSELSMGDWGPQRTGCYLCTRPDIQVLNRVLRVATNCLVETHPDPYTIPHNVHTPRRRSPGPANTRIEAEWTEFCAVRRQCRSRGAALTFRSLFDKRDSRWESSTGAEAIVGSRAPSMRGNLQTRVSHSLSVRSRHS